MARLTVLAMALYTCATAAPADTLGPSNLDYQGAFRVHSSFDWSNGGMAYYPPGDGGNGSLIIFGHAWYGNLGETQTDAALLKKSDGYAKGDLNTATVITQPNNSPDPPYTPGYAGYGLEYLAATGKLYHAQHAGGSDWGGYCDAPDGANPQGPYGNTLDNRRIGHFICEIPSAWEGYVGDGLDPNQVLLTGYDWDQYGRGVTLAAYDGDSPDGSNNLPGTYLVMYDAVNTMTDWDMDDRWAAGAWLEPGDDSVVLVGGRKDITNQANDPDAPDDLKAWLMFYDPADLSAVAHGTKNAYEPQPIDNLNIQDLMFEGDGLIGMAYDRANNRIYGLEESSTNLVVHVWDVVSAMPIPGDTQPDGCVDGLDYGTWSLNYLATGQAPWSAGGYTVGNFNEDDIVDGLDYGVWSLNYLSGCAGGEVPEPAFAMLLIAGLGPLLRRRRSR